jgi:hypothetical protein
MESSQFSSALPTEEPEMSAAGKLFGAIFSPGEAFAAIARKPDFFTPLATLIAASVALNETMLAKIGPNQLMRNIIESSGRAKNMTPDQLDQAVAQGARIFAIFGRLSEFLAVPIILLIVAGAALLIVNTIFGGEITFRTAFSIAAYADMPAVLACIIGFAMIFFGDPTHFNPQSFLPTSPAFFMDPRQTSKPLFALASSLDIFTFWFMILLGLGLSAATRKKVKPAPIFLAFLGCWAVLTAIRAGLALI